jgi:hypothetical protein
MHEAERHDQFVAQGFAGGRRVNERPDDRGRRQAAAPAMAALTLAVVQHESSRRPSAAHALRRQPQRQGVPPRAGAASNSGSSASLPLRTKLGSLVGSGDVAAFAFALAATVMPAVLARVESPVLGASAGGLGIGQNFDPAPATGVDDGRCRSSG